MVLQNILDANDINYLANNLSLHQLTKEMYAAQEHIGEAFDDNNSKLAMFWADYADACQIAIDIQKSIVFEVHSDNPQQRHYETIESIKARYDIVDYIGQFVKLKKSGKVYKGLCPFHSEKSPSFMVYQKEQHWHCFGGCNRGGDVITFVALYNRIDVKSAIRKLAEF